MDMSDSCNEENIKKILDILFYIQYIYGTQLLYVTQYR